MKTLMAEYNHRSQSIWQVTQKHWGMLLELQRMPACWRTQETHPDVMTSLEFGVDFHEKNSDICQKHHWIWETLMNSHRMCACTGGVFTNLSTILTPWATREMWSIACLSWSCTLQASFWGLSSWNKGTIEALAIPSPRGLAEVKGPLHVGTTFQYILYRDGDTITSNPSSSETRSPVGEE